jgi:peptidoglycan/xylan/chitin deacetylase (PgdA/CDA1 family)
MLTSTAKNLAYRSLASTAIPRILHRTLFPNKLTIVTYHGVVRRPLEIYDWCFLDEESFRQQLAYLKKHFDVVSLAAAVDALRAGKLNRPTAVITLDDGYQNNYSIAFPILREFALPATVFIATGFINTDDTFWTLRLNLSLADTKRTSLSWNGENLDLSDTPSRVKANVIIRKSLRDLPRPELMSRLSQIIKLLGEDPKRSIELDSPFRMLTAQAVKEMNQSGLIEFGAHTHTHRILTRLSFDECKNEIELSVGRVEELSGRACRFFAYPLGGREHYNQQSIDILRSLGICAAVTTRPGANDRKTPLLELRRYGAGPNDDMAVFQLKLHHLRPGIVGLSESQ